MQFSHSFSALLMSLFFAVSAPSIVDAIPTGLVRDSDFLLSGSETHNLTERAPKSIRLALKPVLFNGYEEYYTAAINIGTKADSFNMMVDTGGHNLWVLSESASDKNGRNSIGPQSSTTFKDTKEPFDVTYIGNVNTLKGTVATDNVKLGGTTLPNFRFRVANTVEGKLTSVSFDGVMGFARSNPSTAGSPTILEALADAGAISAAVSSWSISRHVDGDTSEVLLGDVNKHLFDGEKAVTLRNNHLPGKQDDGMFRLVVESVAVDNAAAQIPPRVGMLDTGTSMLMIPPVDLPAIRALFPGAVAIQGDALQFAIPCNNQKKLVLEFGGEKFSIEGQDLVAFPVPEAGDNMCLCVIIGVSFLREWMLGLPLWKNAYLSLDVTKDTVMIAPFAVGVAL